MKIKFKKLREGVETPSRAHENDAGLDLKAIDYNYDKEYDNHIYHTGIAVEIPEGYVGLIFPRSSNRNTDSYMTNHVGVIYSGYRGELLVTFKTRDLKLIPIKPYEIGNKIAQLVIIAYEKVEFEEVDELSKSDRGTNGHGSSGK